MLALAADMPSEKVDDLVVKAPDVGQPKVIDQFRIDALTAVGYEIREASISSKITAFNRIIIGKPSQTTRRPQKIHKVPMPDSWSKRHGEVHAHETFASINVASLVDARTLSKRPSCTWQRSFDLSFWVNGAEAQQKLLIVLGRLVDRFLLPRAGIFLSADNAALSSAIFVLDQYVDPATLRSALTFRIEIKSSATEITRDHAIRLRRRLCRSLKLLARYVDIILR
jgi:hypothetical protein